MNFSRLSQLGVRTLSKMFYCGADQLKTERRQNEKDAHDFAGATLRQPALQPGKHGLHENEIE